jgi:acylphosphatase
MPPPADLAAARWIVWFVVRSAESLGVVGWTRNLPDGRVEVVARGRGASLDQLDRQLWSGPTFARVDSVEKLEIPHEDVDCNSFYVR